MSPPDPTPEQILPSPTQTQTCPQRTPSRPCSKYFLNRQHDETPILLKLMQFLTSMAPELLFHAAADIQPNLCDEKCAHCRHDFPLNISKKLGNTHGHLSAARARQSAIKHTGQRRSTYFIASTIIICRLLATSSLPLREHVGIICNESQTALNLSTHQT